MVWPAIESSAGWHSIAQRSLIYARLLPPCVCWFRGAFSVMPVISSSDRLRGYRTLNDNCLHVRTCVNKDAARVCTGSGRGG